MNSIEKVTLTVAAICHDVGHPGRNNQFFINAYDTLAVIYNDVAVLENFHSCLTFRTLEGKDCNIFVNFDDADFRYVRQYLIECILATDMKQHFESISRFRVRRNSPEFNYMKNVEDRWLVARMCVKVADIGHSSVPWSQHFEWSCRVVEEFYLQGAEERARGLPLSPLCDREKHADMAKSQAGFLEFVVKPLLKEIEEIDPFGRVGTEITANIDLNHKKWMTLQEEGTEILLKPHASSSPENGNENSTVTSYAVRKIAGLHTYGSSVHQKSTLLHEPSKAGGGEGRGRHPEGPSLTLRGTLPSVPESIRKHLAEHQTNGDRRDQEGLSDEAKGTGGLSRAWEDDDESDPGHNHGSFSFFTDDEAEKRHSRDGGVGAETRASTLNMAFSASGSFRDSGGSRRPSSSDTGTGSRSSAAPPPHHGSRGGGRSVGGGSRGGPSRSGGVDGGSSSGSYLESESSRSDDPGGGLAPLGGTSSSSSKRASYHHPKGGGGGASGNHQVTFEENGPPSGDSEGAGSSQGNVSPRRGTSQSSGLNAHSLKKGAEELQPKARLFESRVTWKKSIKR